MFCEYRGGKYRVATRLPKDFVDLSKSMWSQKFFYGYGGGSCFAFTTKDAIFYGIFDGPQPTFGEADSLYSLLKEFISCNEKITSFSYDLYLGNDKTNETYYMTIQFTKKSNKLYMSMLTFNVNSRKGTGDKSELTLKSATGNGKPTIYKDDGPLVQNLGDVLKLL